MEKGTPLSVLYSWNVSSFLTWLQGFRLGKDTPLSI